MSQYMMGDVQGCDEALGRLLQLIDFSPSRHTLYVLGDLVNRGPQSLAVLRRLMALGSSAHCLLGNHDLHLLAVAQGVRAQQAGDTLDEVLTAPDRDALLDWLRQRPLALYAHGWLMVHAGVLPKWDVDQTLALAGEVQAALREPDWGRFLSTMYGNTPAAWSPSLQGADRLRVIVNGLTRLRFCSDQGIMEFASKDGAANAPAGCMPWFDVPQRRTAGVPVAFGHWSTLRNVRRADVLALDTGCVWGGCLSAARMAEQPGRVELWSVPCVAACQPDATSGHTTCPSASV